MGVQGHEFTSFETDAQGFGSVFHQISHELRNPLNSISGFAELLLMDEGLSTAHADYVRAILTGSEALTVAVVALLDRVETRGSAPAGEGGREPLAEAQPLLRRAHFERANRRSSQRRLLGKGRSGRP
ncbi:MAG TPA: histidine kinase dimerization/phospho-acceptor domain-containing protein [Novosphingobium sp.]